MILSDREVMAVLDGGPIHIIPRPGPELFSSTAVDLTLDKVLLIWEPKPTAAVEIQAIRPFKKDFNIKALMNDPRWARKVDINLVHGFRFDTRGQFILAYTQQRICLPYRSRIAARVEGKSSLARLGIGVHVTAPTIHAGFGYRPGVPAEETAQPIQLEMFNLTGLPIILDIGMPICQLILEEVREVPTKGYQGQFSEQPVFAVPVTPAPTSSGQGAPRRRRRT
jgi:dCTP deaminase